MNKSPRRAVSIFLTALLVGGWITPEAARAAAPVVIGATGEAGAAGASAAAGVNSALSFSAPAFSASLNPAASIGLAPALSAPALTPSLGGVAADPSIAPSVSPAAVPSTSLSAVAAAPSLNALPAASADSSEPGTPASESAAKPSRGWLSRAAALFTRRETPSEKSAPVSAAAEKAAADAQFDGSAVNPASNDDAVVVPQGRWARLKSGLSRFAARRVENYQTRRAIAHDEFGGPKSDGPMSFGRKIGYGLKWGVNLIGINAVLSFTLFPFLERFAWPLLLSPSSLGHFGRVELLTKFGPSAIGALLAHAPIPFLTIALPMSTAMEEFTYRFMGFGLTFGLLAAAKPLANLVANLLDQIPDAAGFCSTMQKIFLTTGRAISYFAFPIAALTSSFSFAVAHFAAWGVNPVVFAMNLIAGLVLARAAYKSRGLTAPFVAHLVFNIGMLGGAILGVTLGLPGAAMIYAVLSAVVGTAALWYNWRAERKKRAFLKSLGGGANSLLIAALISGAALSGFHGASPRDAAATLNQTYQQVVKGAPAAAPAAKDTVETKAPAAAPADSVAANPFHTDADMIASVKPSVVEIIVKMDQGMALGSGVIVTPTGLLVTNGHVVGDKKVGEIVEVKLADDTKLPAKIVAVNHNKDLAFLMLPKLVNKEVVAWPYSRFAKTAPREGDALFAMGHPLGLPFTVTKGILSGLGYRGNMFVQYLQTDAAITHGNSGGPIYNDRGEIVGINTMGPEVGGIGFSIIAPTVVHALQQFVTTGNMATASMGVIVDLSNPDQPDQGVLVEFVRPGSAADKAGLKPGDLIVGVGDQLIPDGGKKAVHDLAAVLAQAKPGDEIAIGVLRGGEGDKPTIVKIKLDARATTEETSMAHGFDGEDQP